MPPSTMFIVDLTRADLLTLGGHTLVWCALWCTLYDRLAQAMALLLIAMLIDALDGKVARNLGIARPFGRYLGSFVDLLNYTVVPPLILWKLGMNNNWSLVVLCVYSTCGLLRLSKFNEVGNIEQDGELAYLGLPVFWVHFVLMGLFFLPFFLTRVTFRIVCSVALLGLAFCFILNRPFWKPQNYTLITIITLCAATFFGFLGHWSGMWPL